MLFRKQSGFTYLIVGLGNPGENYRRTRHNCGFRAVDCIAESIPDIRFKKRFSALAAECVFGGERVVLLKPQTFMNASGEAVGAAMRYYKLKPQQVLVLSDDASLPLGRIRIRKSGSDGGQKGLRSIIIHLGTDAFPRIRMGIATAESADYDLASFVLGAFDDEENRIIESVLPRVRDAASDIAGGTAVEDAMSKYNGQK